MGGGLRERERGGGLRERERGGGREGGEGGLATLIFFLGN